MKPTIIAKDKEHLKSLFQEEWNLNGNKCDLNHINVSNITDLSYLFNCLDFHGDISKWDVSNVTDMSGLFFACEFNGDISNWDVSNVKDMRNLFFNSKFNGDLTEWKPLSLISCKNVFNQKQEKIPYWAKYEDNESRNKSIDAYHLHKQLNADLNKNKELHTRIKI
jgi:hypothetical protein